MIRQCAVNKHKKPLQKVCLSFIVVSFKDAIISYFFGSHTVILVPIPSLERFSKCPRCLSTIHLAMDNPSPVLPVLLFLTSSEQKNRSKICATFCSFIPTLLSWTEKKTSPSSFPKKQDLIPLLCTLPASGRTDCSMPVLPQPDYIR